MSIASTRCDRSYPLVHPELVDAMILSPSDGELPADCGAELREISAASAKLLVAGPPELPCRCRLRLVSSKLTRTLVIFGEIAWARLNPTGDWLIECEFDKRMSETRFAELVASGLLERRSAIRFQTRIPVDIRWSREAPRIPGMIRDLSEGGLCLMTSQAPEQTRSIHTLVQTPNGEETLRLKVRWSLCVGPNYLIGCQFIHGQDFHLLRSLNLNLASNPSAGLNEFARGGQPRDQRP